MLASNKNQIQFNECYKQVHLGLNVRFFTENYWDGAAETFAYHGPNCYFPSQEKIA